jgi:hypothetical protein
MNRVSLTLLAFILLGLRPAHANSIERLDFPLHSTPHFDGTISSFSGVGTSSWFGENDVSHSDLEFHSPEKNGIRSALRWSREQCGRSPSDSNGPVPSVTPSIAAVPEVPTAWLMMLGTCTLLSVGRVRGLFERLRS